MRNLPAAFDSVVRDVTSLVPSACGVAPATCLTPLGSRLRRGISPQSKTSDRSPASDTPLLKDTNNEPSGEPRSAGPAPALRLDQRLLAAPFVLDSEVTGVLAWAPMNSAGVTIKGLSADQSQVAEEIVEAVAAVSGQAVTSGDVLSATLAELERRYASASDVAERAVAHQRIVGAARDVVKARAAAALNGEPVSGALSDKQPTDATDDERSSTRDELSGGGAPETTAPSAEAVRTTVSDVVEGDATGRRPGGGGDSAQSGDPAAASWPKGPRTGVDLHKRSNYGRIIGCVGEGLERQAAVRDALGLKQNATQMAMTKLVSDGYLNKDDDGRYTLTDKGRRAFDELTTMFADNSKEATAM